MGASELRKSVCFDGELQGQSDFRAGRNAGLRDEDILEGHEEKEDSVPEDLAFVS